MTWRDWAAIGGLALCGLMYAGILTYIFWYFEHKEEEEESKP